MNVKSSYHPQRGAGRLYWCGYGNEINTRVQDLIETIKANGREVYYVSTDGFDKTMLNLSIVCFEDSDEYLKKVEEIKRLYSGKGIICSPFHIEEGNVHKVIKSNLLPFKFPKACFQFEVGYAYNKNPWIICRELIKDLDLTAVPYKGM